MDEDDIELKKKLAEDKKALKEAQAIAQSRGPIGSGGKKISKK